MSCPRRAFTSAAASAGSCVYGSRSTLTSTSFCSPQAWAQVLNQALYRGTKCAHCATDRSSGEPAALVPERTGERVGRSCAGRPRPLRPRRRRAAGVPTSSVSSSPSRSGPTLAHRGTYMIGVFVSAKTESSGASNSTAPDAPVLEKAFVDDAAATVAVPDQKPEERVRRKPADAVGHGSARGRRDRGAVHVEAENRDVARGGDVGRQQLRPVGARARGQLDDAPAPRPVVSAVS